MAKYTIWASAVEDYYAKIEANSLEEAWEKSREIENEAWTKPNTRFPYLEVYDVDLEEE